MLQEAYNELEVIIPEKLGIYNILSPWRERVNKTFRFFIQFHTPYWDNFTYL